MFMRKKIFFLLLVFLLSLTFINTVFAEDTLPQAPTDPKTPPPVSGTVSLPNPLGKDNPTPQVLLGKIINYSLGLIGSLALVMFIYGGAVWMLSGGNQEQVAKGKNTLIWAAIGIVVIFTAYALVKFVLTAMTAAGT